MSEEGYGAYDPTAPEDGPARSQYVSKKDVRVVAVAIAVLLACGWPIFKMLERRAQSSVCLSNMGAISNAISQYAVLHDDRFPPIMRTGPNNQPDLGDSGHPYCWASDVVALMSPRSSFRCPAADSKELCWVEGEKQLIPLTYGMYYPYGAYLRTIIPNPDQTALIAETSNEGSNQTFDPLAYPGGWDGFVVGWNTSNDMPGATTNIATRLAFPDTATGVFHKTGAARHDKGIHVLNCDGALINVLPTGARISMSRGLPSGLWQSPPASALVH
jgi:hypothetical protein